jgi:MFS family permease
MILMDSAPNNLSNNNPTPGKKGLFYGWYIVSAAIVGLALGYSVVAVMSFGTFINPLEEEFGWSRGQISLGLSIIGFTAIFVFPLTGILVDKLGAKRILIPSSFLFAGVMASMYFLTPSLWHFYGMCVLIPILGSGTAPLTYSRLIFAWFDRKRGLALGVGLAGVGLGTSLVPLFATWIMDQYSWREAYVAIGILMGIAYDLVGQYDEILWAMSGIMLIACVLVLLMPRYPELPEREI